MLMLKRCTFSAAAAILFCLPFLLPPVSYGADLPPIRSMPQPAIGAGDCPSFSFLAPFVIAQGRVGAPYRHRIKISDPKRSVRLQIIAGRLPEGLTMDKSGRISGIPGKPGRYPFTVRASLDCSTRASRVEGRFTLNIQASAVKISAETRPKSIQWAAGRDMGHPVRYLLRCTPCTGLKLYSSGGRFMVRRRTVGQSVQPLTVVIKGDQTWVGENLTIGRSVIAGALKSGAREIAYVRSFSSKNPSVSVQTHLRIRIAPQAPVGQKDMKFALDGQARRSIPQSAENGPTPAQQTPSPASSFLPGQIVVTTAASPTGRSTIERLSRKYPLKTAESYEMRAIQQIVTVFTTRDDVIKLVKQIGRESGVKHVQTNRLFHTFLDPRDDLQHIYAQLNLADLHHYYQGNGVRVAIIDTGVDIRHPDLRDRVIQHANLLPDNPYRAEIHGTAMAGVMAASINDYGISGIAPRAELIALRACWQTSDDLPEGRCTSVSVSKALDMAIAFDARIVNMSFGATAPDWLMMQLLDAGAKKSILFVAPVGNRKDLKKIPFPASYSKVLAVAGRDEQGGFYPNADLASAADICAPAGNLLTTVPGGRHNFMSGTSLSAAVVSGLLAVAKEKNRFLGLNAVPAYDGDICRWQEKLINQTFCKARALHGRNK